jgi:Ubiquitin-2 like Rad60 SUMO-like
VHGSDTCELQCPALRSCVQIFGVYCDKKGYDMNTVRFLFDGTLLQPNQQVSEAEIEDGDCIDCVMAQVGGRLHYEKGQIWRRARRNL